MFSHINTAQSDRFERKCCHFVATLYANGGCLRDPNYPYTQHHAKGRQPMNDEQEEQSIKNLRVPHSASRQTTSYYDSHYSPGEKSYEDRVQTKLSWLVFFGALVAAAVVANFIAGLIIAGSAASAVSSGY